MSTHPRQTLIYSPTFRWNGDLLEQEVQIIQHYPERDRDVGIFREWLTVKVNGMECRRPEQKRTIFPEIPGWEPPPPQPKEPRPLREKLSGRIPSKSDVSVPEGFTLVEFDGGTSCNIPAQGYGEGYGSFQIDNGKIHRLQFGTGFSSNASEILTLAGALEHLCSVGAPDKLKLFIRGDSQIALKWATANGDPKPKTSECFKLAIATLRKFTVRFAHIKTEWRGRRHSMNLFGH